MRLFLHIIQIYVQFFSEKFHQLKNFRLLCNLKIRKNKY